MDNSHHQHAIRNHELHLLNEWENVVDIYPSTLFNASGKSLGNPLCKFDTSNNPNDEGYYLETCPSVDIMHWGMFYSNK